MASDYWKLLQSPLWQKKRLLKLEQANWECSYCGLKDKQLHVHHKQYIKGRMPWEYDDEQLDVLCNDCHESMHEVASVLKELLSYSNQEEIYSLLLGYSEDEIISKLEYSWPEYASIQYRAIGTIAGLLNFVHPKHYEKIANLLINKYAINKDEAKEYFRKKYMNEWEYL